MHNVGVGGFRGVDVGRLHPARIALLAPVNERRLAAHRALRRVYHLAVVGHGAAPYPVGILQPRAVARYLIHLPGRQEPYHTVGADGPRAAAARILHYHPATVHLALQRRHRRLRLQRRHTQDDGVRHIARPHARPFLACAQRGVGLHGVHHLVETHVIDGCQQLLRRLQTRIGAKVILAPPCLLHRHEISRPSLIIACYLLFRHGVSLVFTLHNAVAHPGVGCRRHHRVARSPCQRREACQRAQTRCEYHSFHTCCLTYL